MVTADQDEQQFNAWKADAIVPMPEPPTVEFDMLRGLMMLREQFPPERVEKLPKPLWKGAWDGDRKGNCPECHGYHVLSNTIHLDYVGHANCTDRLLEADPWWDWEPLAYTPEGLPLFDRSGGLWIKLTVCGMTRIGYGDGNSPKEIIGDAIRNAAMRFGVALDLWAKINLHEERNPGDGPTQSRDVRSGTERRPDERRGPRQDGDGGRNGDEVASNPAQNQDALDELASICDEHGYDRRSCGPMFKEWSEQQDHRVNPRLIDADSDDIRLFAASLVVMATEDDRGEGVAGDNPDATESADATPEDGGDGGGEPGADQPEGDATADDDGGSVGEVASGDRPAVDPSDTSDVEKKPGDLF